MKNTTATDRLTRRQIQTLRLIAGGYTNRQIAGLLSIKLKTVEKHRQGLMDKLDIHQVATLTRYAVSNGIVEVNWPPVGRSPAFSLTREIENVLGHPGSRNSRANGSESGLEVKVDNDSQF